MYMRGLSGTGPVPSDASVIIPAYMTTDLVTGAQVMIPAHRQYSQAYYDYFKMDTPEAAAQAAANQALLDSQQAAARQAAILAAQQEATRQAAILAAQQEAARQAAQRQATQQAAQQASTTVVHETPAIPSITQYNPPFQQVIDTSQMDDTGQQSATPVQIPTGQGPFMLGGVNTKYLIGGALVAAYLLLRK